MKQCVNKFLTGTFVCALIISGCAATSYNQKQSSDNQKHNEQEKVSKYFYRIRVADNIYQVGMEGQNGYFWNELSAFLLRGCTQITLEHGKQYFALYNPIDSSFSTISDGRSTNSQLFRHQHAMMKILPDHNQSVKLRLNAVTIIKSTNEITGDKLSKKARKTFHKFEQASAKSDQ